MRKFRKIKRNIMEYNDILMKNPDKAKEISDEALYELEQMQKILEEYLNKRYDDFLIYCDKSVTAFLMPENTYFQRIRRYIPMKKVNFYLDKCSYDITELEIWKENLQRIKSRFEQIKYFL